MTKGYGRSATIFNGEKVNNEENFPKEFVRYLSEKLSAIFSTQLPLKTKSCLFTDLKTYTSYQCCQFVFRWTYFRSVCGYTR